MREIVAAARKKNSAKSTFSQNEFMIRNKSNEPSGNSISFRDGQMAAAISNGSFLKILDGLRKSFQVTRKIENDALKKFAKELESLFKDSLSSVQEEKAKMKFAMESLRVQNSKLVSETGENKNSLSCFCKTKIAVGNINSCCGGLKIEVKFHQQQITFDRLQTMGICQFMREEITKTFQIRNTIIN